MKILAICTAASLDFAALGWVWCVFFATLPVFFLFGFYTGRWTTKGERL